MGWLTGEIELPVNIVLLRTVSFPNSFQPIIEIMQEAQETLGKRTISFH